MTKFDHKIKIPGYRIIRQIGEGGMSVVYLAFQESLKREVALKIMRPIVTDEENVVKRFEQEAEIIAKLYHPNIVNIYEVGHVEGDVLFYSMPYLQHGDLTSVAYQDDAELKQMIVDICEGLAFAHTQGVVHRDIKPENILFDQFGNVQIADFGIALSTGRRRFTKDSKIVGSVYYMSPEQAQAKHVDKRSDVYGLGAILYELLTGDPVFDEDSDLSMMMAHLSSPVPKLPAELSHWQHVIDKCLAKSPSQRFQSMDELKQAVLAVSANKINVWQSTPVIASAAALTLAVVFLSFWMMSSDGPIKKDKSGPSEFIVAENQTNTAPAVTNDSINSASDERIEANNSENKAVNGSSFAINKNDSGDEYSKEFLDEFNQDFNQITGQDLDAGQLDNSEGNDELAVKETGGKLSEAQVLVLLAKAKSNIDDKQLTTPADDNALDQILQVLKNNSEHRQALELLSDVMGGYYELLYQAVQQSDLRRAQVFADSVAEVRQRTILVNESLMTQLEQNTGIEQSLLIGVVIEKVKAYKQAMNQPQAKRLINIIDQVIPGQELVGDLMDSISTMLKPGQVLSDNLGIKTVVVTPQFNSKDGLLNYGLAVTQSEITFAQYDRFVKATDHKLRRCKSKIKANMFFSQRNYTKPGFKVSNDMPVVCVTWHDANQYASWLSQQTGLSYRLPTEREWLHTKKLSDQAVKCGSANLAGQEFPDKSEDIDLFTCDDGSANVAAITKFPKNKLGLSGLQGNVSEWLAGCEKLGKFKAIFNPDDLCDNNPVIGQSWISGRDDRGAVQQINFDQAWTHIGFRLIRDLRKEN